MGQQPVRFGSDHPWSFLKNKRWNWSITFRKTLMSAAYICVSCEAPYCTRVALRHKYKVLFSCYFTGTPTIQSETAIRALLLIGRSMLVVPQGVLEVLEVWVWHARRIWFWTNCIDLCLLRASLRTLVNEVNQLLLSSDCVHLVRDASFILIPCDFAVGRFNF